MYYADDAVDSAFVNRHTRVAVIHEYLFYPLHIGVYLYAHDVHARYEHLVDRCFVEVER